jgi:hypothetical protein
MNAPEQGIFHKFNVSRVDGTDATGGKHEGCKHFVLDLTHDKHAIPAIAAYAQSCKEEYPQLAEDLRTTAVGAVTQANVFVTVPETTLPGGVVVPSFSVAKYLTGQGPLDIPITTEAGIPRVDIEYADARAAAAGAGLVLITETQWLAIAHDIASQAINWSGGVVGEGKIFQGIHKGTLGGGTAANVTGCDDSERRWHQLSNGEQVFDFAGNVYSWVFDDVQGDADGIVAKAFTPESLSILTAPAPSREKGVGYQPRANADWSGLALIRGGYWGGRDCAGVFALNLADPDDAYDDVGFRCTKPSTGV